MASFVIHTLAAEMLLKEIENQYRVSLSAENTKRFLLGNLIVDSLRLDMSIPEHLQGQELIDYKMELKRKNREEKISTHFRDPSKEENVLKLPEPDLFISKYSKLISQDISVLGYFFHLYTDRYFFSSLFPKTFISLKSDGTIATKEKESHTIRILKNNKEVSDSIFWTGTSPLSIYSDYTILNKILLEYFSTSFDPDILLEYARFSFNNPGIEEVDYFRIAEIVLKTKKFIDDSYKSSETELNVFDEVIVKKFIQEVVTSFLAEHSSLLLTYLPPIEKQLKKRKINMIFASNNKGKIREIKSIFQDEEIISLKEANVDIDVVEDADSFYGNALKKAKEIFELTNTAVIADDSGICIDAFDGWPGVLTHRFAGEEATEEERNIIMLDKVNTQDNKNAKVICNLVYYDGTDIVVGEGILKGTIVSPRGTNGFGFDPIFELESGKTLAELTSEEKNITSARYLAALDLKNKLGK